MGIAADNPLTGISLLGATGGSCRSLCVFPFGVWYRDAQPV